MKKRVDFFHNLRSSVFKQPLTIVLIAFFLLGFFFRFYNTPDRFGFDKDPTRDVLISLYGSDTFQFPLIGPHSGIGSFTFGPWYYYELILTRLIFSTDFAAFYLIPAYSFAVLILLFLLGRKLKDSRLGVILTGLAAYSPAQVTPAGGLSNPNLVTAHAVATVLFFCIYLQGTVSLWWAFAWGIVLGIGINHHFQMLPLLLLPFVAYLVTWRRAFLPALVFTGGLFTAFIPLFFFNLLNNWHTVSGFFAFFRGGNTTYAPNNWMIYLRDFWPSYWSYFLGVPVWLGLLLGIIVVVAHGYQIYKKLISQSYLLILFILGILFLALRYYSGTRETYYLFYIQPFLFLILGMTFWTIWQQRFGKLIAIVIGIVLLTASLPFNMVRLSDRADQIQFRKEAQLLLQKYPGEKLSIVNCNEASINRPEGIAFFLYHQGLISETGRKIATIDINSNCQFPKGHGEQVAEDLYDFSRVSSEELERYGWWIVSPKTVYQKTVRWWIDPKANI